MSTRSVGEEERGEAPVAPDEPGLPADVPEDPIGAAASRGDNPMGMFAGSEAGEQDDFRIDMPPAEPAVVPPAPASHDQPVPEDPTADVVRRLRETARRERVGPPPVPRRHWPLRRTWVLAAALVIVAAVSFTAWRLYRRSPSQPAAPAAPQDGQLTIDSRPIGAPVEIDGVARGTTPVGVRLKAGHHVVRVGGPSGREIDAVVTAGGEVAHHIELADVRTRLRVATEPSGAVVRVDGGVRGVAPLDLTDVAPGVHTITAYKDGASMRREVDVRAGADNSVVIALIGGPTTGWVTVSAAFDVDVYEGTRLVGRSRDGQLLLVAGRHELTLSNTELGYHDTSRVLVSPGATAQVSVPAVQGQLSVNAIPWAEVFIDGQRIGETPISNYATPIGRHEVMLRHPQLGEQRRTVVVAVGTPARVGANFTR